MNLLPTRFIYSITFVPMSPCSSQELLLTLFIHPFIFSSCEDEKPDEHPKSLLSHLQPEERCVAAMQGSSHCTAPGCGLPLGGHWPRRGCSAPSWVQGSPDWCNFLFGDVLQGELLSSGAELSWVCFMWRWMRKVFCGEALTSPGKLRPVSASC